MRKILLTIFLFVLLTIYFVFLEGCTINRKVDDPLIVPPNFAEVPDPNNPEKPNEKQKDADIAKLKDLLLKSE